MKYKIKYFASLREKAEKSSEEIEGDYDSLNDLYDELYIKYNFSIDKKNLRASINGEYCDFNTCPKDNDTVVFIPPVAGG